jgi:hypothetical protein
MPRPGECHARPPPMAGMSVFFYGDATFADLQFNTGGLGFFTVDIDAQSGDDDQKSTDNEVQTVAVQCLIL